MVSVITSGLLLPLISLNGPKTSWPPASPSRQAVKLNWASEAVVFRSTANSGSAGKYMSIDNGPNAVSDPNIRTIHTLFNFFGLDLFSSLFSAACMNGFFLSIFLKLLILPIIIHANSVFDQKRERSPIQTTFSHFICRHPDV